MNRCCVKIAALVLFSLSSSCSTRAPAPAAGESKAPSNNAATTQVIASIAASAAEVVETLNAKFQQKTGAEVKVNAGASNALAAQILAGAPADVFLSASPEWAAKLKTSGRTAREVELLSNRLVAVVPHGNPAEVHEPKDLGSDAVKKIAVAGENVPAGKYADQALTKLGLLEQLSRGKKIARGEDVRATLSFVERGEAEAGIVYASDARAVPGVEVAFEFDPGLHDRIIYVLVLVKEATENPAAERYYDFLRSPLAAAAFKQAGFTPLSRAGSAASTE